MKLYFHNDQLNDPSCNGSFAISSRELCFASQELGVYANAKQADYIIFMDAFDVEKKVDGKPTIPFIMSEYNCAYGPVVEKLIKNNTFCFSISDQSTKSFINAGLPPELIKTVHLGARASSWPNLNKRTRKFGEPLIYITNNSSNNRSGYQDFIPAWLDFAKGKNVKLVIKDQENPKFRAILQQIDKDQTIIYEGRNISYEKMVTLYNQCHIGVYCNSCTSYGLTILEKVLSGLPVIVSNASAIPEFTDSETVSYIECDEVPVNHLLIGQWSSWGLKNNLPPLHLYRNQLIAPRPKYDSILANLEHSFKNYEKLLEKNQKFVKNIHERFTWAHSVQNIIKILENK